MAVVMLRAPLKDRAGGSSKLTVEGASVLQVLRALETEHPAIVGWVLDDVGQIRPHVNVFVDGELVRHDAEVGPDARIHVLPSITGGSG